MRTVSILLESLYAQDRWIGLLAPRCPPVKRDYDVARVIHSGLAWEGPRIVAQSFPLSFAQPYRTYLGGPCSSSALLSHHRIPQLLLYLSSFSFSALRSLVPLLTCNYSSPTFFTTDHDIASSVQTACQLSSRRILSRANKRSTSIRGGGAWRFHSRRRRGWKQARQADRVDTTQPPPLTPPLPPRHPTILASYCCTFHSRLSASVRARAHSIILPPAPRGYTRSALPLSMHS